MKKKLAEYLSPETASERWFTNVKELGISEFAVIKNLDFILSPIEIYPLAAKVTQPLDRVAAFVVDMDGTSTTTEPLALHSLEFMVRRFTNRMTKEEWAGLDKVHDYPFVIGNSNFRHTEFLVERYREFIDTPSLRLSFIESLIWTLSWMDDIHRLKDIKQDAINVGFEPILADDEFKAFIKKQSADNQITEFAKKLDAKYADCFDISNFGAMVSAALDIYYHRYHAILRLVERGEGERLSHELLGESGRRLVEPMPGYGIFVALIKGWLGEHAVNLYDNLVHEFSKTGSELHVPETIAKKRLVELGKSFEKQPAKLALVTASIAYETHATIKEIFNVIHEQASDWDIPQEKKDNILQLTSDYHQVFDSVVCATDSWEARLKPHRDLYNIALYRMSIPKEDYCRCVGLEDTEPGIISLRSAGIGCAVALPNHDTNLQDYSAAAHVVHGGLPELILNQNLLTME